MQGPLLENGVTGVLQTLQCEHGNKTKQSKTNELQGYLSEVSVHCVKRPNAR